MKNDPNQFVTVGQFAAMYPPLQSWQVRRVFERKLVAESQRIGTYRAISKKDFPKVIDALKAAGFWPEAQG